MTCMTSATICPEGRFPRNKGLCQLQNELSGFCDGHLSIGFLQVGCRSLQLSMASPPEPSRRALGPGCQRSESGLCLIPGTLVVFGGTGGNCGVGGGWTFCLFHWPHGPAQPAAGSGDCVSGGWGCGQLVRIQPAPSSDPACVSTSVTT